MRIEAGSRLLFIGDSITDCGRAQPVGEEWPWAADGLGRGYVALVNAYLGAAFAERRIRVMNVGTSGDTVRDLAARWPGDVVERRPDWLAVMIGINDVWRQFDSPLRPELQVLPDEYERTLRALVGEMRPLLTGLVLMTPYFVEANRDDPMRRTMDAYGQMVRQVALETGALLVDTQAAFDALLEHVYSGTLAWDRVHPGAVGHMAIARAFLKAVGAL